MVVGCKLNPETIVTNELPQIAALLLEHRSDKEDWGEISGFENQPCPKRVANKFLVCCLLDWQMDSGLAWRNGERLVKDILGNPDDIILRRKVARLPENASVANLISMSTKCPKVAPRKPREDAERNSDRILEVAKEAFTRFGADASLNDIAKQACCVW